MGDGGVGVGIGNDPQYLQSQETILVMMKAHHVSARLTREHTMNCDSRTAWEADTSITSIQQAGDMAG